MGRSFEECLVAEIQKYPLIYDKGNISYRNKIKRERAWNEVSKKFGVSSEDVQLRWRTLRDRFVRELSKSPGADKWRFFEHMEFLKDHVSARTKKIKNEYTSAFFDEVILPSPTMSSTSHFMHESSVANHQTLNEPKEQSQEDIRPPAAKKHRDDDNETIDMTKNDISLLGIVHELIKNTYDRQKEKSRNEDFLNTLDSYILKLDEDQQDALKVEILSFTHKRALEIKNDCIVYQE